MNYFVNLILYLSLKLLYTLTLKLLLQIILELNRTSKTKSD